MKRNITIIIGILLLGILFFVTYSHYNDYTKENVENKISRNNEIEQNKKYVPLEKLPEEYSFEQALKDECFIISYKDVYNKDKLDEFIKNTEVNSKNRVSDILRIVQFTIEGDMILIDVEYTKEGKYVITHDNTRDKFATKEDRTITKEGDFLGKIYSCNLKEEAEQIKLLLYKTDFMEANEKEYTICSYPKTATIYQTGPTFKATVLQVEENLFFVKPEETQNLRR